MLIENGKQSKKQLKEAAEDEIGYIQVGCKKLRNSVLEDNFDFDFLEISRKIRVKVWWFLLEFT